MIDESIGIDEKSILELLKGNKEDKRAEKRI